MRINAKLQEVKVVALVANALRDVTRTLPAGCDTRGIPFWARATALRDSAFSDLPFPPTYATGTILFKTLSKLPSQCFFRGYVLSFSATTATFKPPKMLGRRGLVMYPKIALCHTCRSPKGIVSTSTKFDSECCNISPLDDHPKIERLKSKRARHQPPSSTTENHDLEGLRIRMRRKSTTYPKSLRHRGRVRCPPLPAPTHALAPRQGGPPALHLPAQLPPRTARRRRARERGARARHGSRRRRLAVVSARGTRGWTRTWMR